MLLTWVLLALPKTYDDDDDRFRDFESPLILQYVITGIFLTNQNLGKRNELLKGIWKALSYSVGITIITCIFWPIRNEYSKD